MGLTHPQALCSDAESGSKAPSWKLSGPRKQLGGIKYIFLEAGSLSAQVGTSACPVTQSPVTAGQSQRAQQGETVMLVGGSPLLLHDTDVSGLF